MATNSSIEWTTKTWNPVLGCSMVSPGCAHCYAESMSRRHAGIAKARTSRGESPGRSAHYIPVINAKGRWSGVMELVPEALDEPLSWKQPQAVFVNSMSDLFHENLSVDAIGQVFRIMNQASQHVFQVLTKRSTRLMEQSPRLTWTPNIWQGVSVENQDYAFRIDHLRRTGARIKFLSVEPLLGPVGKLDLSGINWVITGGESGPGCRPMKVEWVQELRDLCVKSGVKFFFKQWGDIRNNPDPADPTAKQNAGGTKGGRMLDGRTWDEMPGASIDDNRSQTSVSVQ